jgi:hypothetical protein
MRATALALALLVAPACAARATAPSPGTGTPGVAGRASADRKLVRTARLGLEVDDGSRIEATVNAAGKVASDLGGHALELSTGRAWLAVPAERLDDALAQLSALGEVEEREVRALDVTAEHADLGLRVESARRLEARLRELVQASQDVTQVLAVERELARVTEELERLLAAQRRMETDIAMATVDVRVRESVSPGPLGWVFYGLFTGIKWLFVID